MPSGGAHPTTIASAVAAANAAAGGATGVWLVVGNEAHGLRPELQALIGAGAGAASSGAAGASSGVRVQALTVPMHDASESLNVAVAASLAMFTLSPYATAGAPRAPL